MARRNVEIMDPYRGHRFVRVGSQARRPSWLDGPLNICRVHFRSARASGCLKYSARCCGHQLVAGTTGLPQKAGARFASYGSASHPAIINGKDSRKADAALAFN